MVKVRPPQSPPVRSAVTGELLVLPFKVIADDRERAGGWRFMGQDGGAKHKHRPLLVPMTYARLQTADYRIDGLPCFIERKSHDDAIGSIGGGHVRFRAEHERMQAIIEAGGFCCVIVESSLSAIVEELEGGLSARDLSAETAIGVVASWQQRYRVPWNFAGTREVAERLALRVMWKFFEQQQEQKRGEGAGKQRSG